MEVKKDVKEKKEEKKEKKFNSERVSRLAKNALKAVFPNETFVVSSLVEKVKVLYPASSKLTQLEINTFKAVFCDLVKIEKEKILVSQFEEKAV